MRHSGWGTAILTRAGEGHKDRINHEGHEEHEDRTPEHEENLFFFVS
jgi:hypothetical protein